MIAKTNWCGSWNTLAPALPPVLELGRQAASFSRFVADPRIPPSKATELFDIWTNRSTLREMADLVLVANPAGSSDIVGMVTVALRQDGGQIGLIAVDPKLRGLGIGTALVHSANRWTAGKGLIQGWVVTQAVNTSACRLYERTGYVLYQVERFYHSWPCVDEKSCPDS